MVNNSTDVKKNKKQSLSTTQSVNELKKIP